MRNKKPMSPLKMYILLITYTVVLVMLFIQKNEIFGMIGKILGYMRPFFIGIVIAYVLNAPMRALENKVFPKILKKAKKRNPRLERGSAVAVTVLFAVAIVTAIVSVLIPQLADSISVFISNIESYVQSLENFTNSIAERFHLEDAIWQEIESIGTGILDNIVTTIQNSMPEILNTTKDIMTAIASGLFTILMSTIISVYMLYHKEKLMNQLKSVIRAFLPEKATKFIFDTAIFANDTFGKFVGGQITEASILGALCFIGTSILGIQYALLISVIIGITNLIPIFGPWIGTAISAFLLLMIDPVKALWFIIFIVVLQQLENNLIYPKVVGSSIGLSGLWVIFAIIVCGGLFGVAGIFLGIPLFAVLTKLGQDYIKRRLAEKEKRLTEMEDGETLPNGEGQGAP
ncbi:MAG: AI-2E family transporter [Clostridiaceae bacterium]|nr:AI-2E family transporter [Clostridiaceae bacterium]